MKNSFLYTRERILILHPSKLEFRQKKSTLFFNQRKKENLSNEGKVVLK
jgi:hypothetical protein